ncbi:MAG: pyruvate, phosphate dikinase [Thermomicrobiales bacterium]
MRRFTEGSAADRDLLGGKGANLAEMTRLGLPVPPGFTVTTEACRSYLEHGSEAPDTLWDEVRCALNAVGEATGRQFGDVNEPLLVSVRSGAKFSMPGMMDTILNLGLTQESVEGFGKVAGERFVLDAFRRLLHMFGHVALGIPDEPFEEIMTHARASAGVQHDHELSIDQMRDVVEQALAVYPAHGLEFPNDPWEQLRLAILAVFRSWNTERAMAYREAEGIPHDLGTAANVQAMVFGNLGETSASGVAFTRDPSTGAPGLFGEYLVNAQGEDVVAGIRTPFPIAEMGENKALAGAYNDLLDIAEKLESHYKDMQDLEFTVERGTLYMLQTRTGKRTADAAARIAVDLVEQGLIDPTTAVGRVEPDQVERLLHPRIDDSESIEVIARGLPASPGAVTGRPVFTSEEAVYQSRIGVPVILIRPETSADDFPGINAAAGVLTARGGMTSHAAVVARGMGKPAVTGCAELEIDVEGRTLTVDGRELTTTDLITIDGATGRVILGAARMRPADLNSPEIKSLLEWADRERRLKVRANADTPEDAARARAFGAEGIGLCRTEHMFFATSRLPVMRKMILARTDAERTSALDTLEAFQETDFYGIFKAMDGFAVTIRTLDPPLHEFLPSNRTEINTLAAEIGWRSNDLTDRIESMREENPMLGLRGCRVGVLWPEVTRMQARAIFRAAVRCRKEGIVAIPEIMIPLVSTPEELKRQKAVVDKAANEIFEEAGERVDYLVGTMIEVPRAALIADDIAEHAEFFSFGTNDLTQTTMALSRDDSGSFLATYLDRGILPADPFRTIDQAGVGQLVQMGVSRGRSRKTDLKLGICGEHGGDPVSVDFFHRTGLDYVSCSPFRVPVARLAAAHAALGSEAADR